MAGTGKWWQGWLGAMVAALLSLAGPAAAVEVQFQRVADGVYAFIGETGGRTFDNEGLNANIGLVVTHEGAVLIDSGATWQGAQKIAKAARLVTPQPIRWVINTGGQDHRWLGNGYFAAQGAQVIAHEAARADMQQRGGDHLATLKAALKDRADGTVPTLPTRWLSGAETPLTLGGMAFTLVHRGGGHTPGDTMVWLPVARLAFSGDIVYVQRMLGVIPVSSTQRWVQAFQALEALQPLHIVPGHGRVTNLQDARADTLAYLQALRAHMKKAVDDGTDVSAAVKAFDAQPFLRLLNAAELHPGNASRTYLELERE